MESTPHAAFVGALLLLWLGVGACQPYGNLPRVAAERAGCGDADTVFSDIELANGRREWAMECNGEAWACSGTSAVDAVCERARAALPAASHERPGPQLPWVVYESAECGVRVDFPGVPVVATTEIATSAGPRAVESGTLALPGVDRAMVATCADLGAAGASAEGLMDAAERGMLARTGARLLAEQPSVGGRELRLAVHDAEVWARIVMVGENRLMTLVVAPIRAFSLDDARRFLDSPRAAPRPSPSSL